MYLAAFYRNPRQVCLFTPFVEDACSYRDKNMALDGLHFLYLLKIFFLLPLFIFNNIFVKLLKEVYSRKSLLSELY